MNTLRDTYCQIYIEIFTEPLQYFRRATFGTEADDSSRREIYHDVLVVTSGDEPTYFQEPPHTTDVP